MQESAVLENRLTVNEAAELAKVHHMTIRRWIAAGRLPFARTGSGRLKIKPEDLTKFLSLD